MTAIRATRRFLSRNEVARILGVVPSTVTRWAKMGLIPTVTTIGGHHRYYESDIQRLAKELNRGRLPGSFRLGHESGRKRTTEAHDDPGRRSATGPYMLEDRGQHNGSTSLVEVRWHGRGGQGVVTASEILAEAALTEERYFQAFPEFGPERTGAPLRAFTRLSNAPITVHYPVSHPDIVVILDSTLLRTVDVLEGLKEGGIAVINTPLKPSALKAHFNRPVRWRIVTVNATRIALEAFKRNVPNTPMLGALLRVAPLVSTENCLRFLRKRLGPKLPIAIVEANVSAFQRAYAEAI